MVSGVGSICSDLLLLSLLSLHATNPTDSKAVNKTEILNFMINFHTIYYVGSI